MSDSATPWTGACQAALSTEFSRSEYWSGLPFPSPEDLPNPGIKPRSPTSKADFYHLSHQGSPNLVKYYIKLEYRETKCYCVTMY